MGRTHPALGLLRRGPGGSIPKGREPHEQTEPFRIVRGDSNGGLLRARTQTPGLYPGLFRGLHLGFGIRILAGSMALRHRGTGLGGDRLHSLEKGEVAASSSRQMAAQSRLYPNTLIIVYGAVRVVYLELAARGVGA